MKKSVIFLINGLGIERPGSYSIAIDECMPQLCKIKDSSYYTSAVIDSLEPKEAYQSFFLGDSFHSEVDYIKNYVMNNSLLNNNTFHLLKQSCMNNHKFHIFIEATNDKIVEELNYLLNLLQLDPTKKIYLHFILPQQVVKEYSKIISIINTIKYHLDSRVDVGFILGKDSFSEPLTKQQLDYAKKMFFYCSCERWSETDKKLRILETDKIRPNDVVGFSSSNSCNLEDGDTIFFFNTRREKYDALITSIIEGEKSVFQKTTISFYSFIRLNTVLGINSFIDNIDYENSLSNILLRNQKRMLILTDVDNINLVNFYANGLNSINNPIICFMEKSDNLYRKDYIERLINDMPYDLFLFDYKMDTSSTVNHLKEELSKLDVIIGNLASVCENRHSLFITSLYGLNCKMPVADYNPEMVTIDYELQIPIFFFDYSYPASKYDLFPGETNDVLSSALKCITDDPKLETLIREKTIIGSIIKSFIK
ncbi:MAG: hypothetical protein IJG68_00285 [Bacilli bacterium]|nr:hypothetical protein [Bacilli bacterium]